MANEKFEQRNNWGNPTPKPGVTPENWSTVQPKDESKLYTSRKMPEEGRAQGTWGGGVSRP